MPFHPEYIRRKYVGKKFGLLTVVEHVGKDSKGLALVKCICECKDSTEIIVYSSRINSGHTRSCGCLATHSKNLRRSGLIEGQEKYLLSFEYLSRVLKYDPITGILEWINTNRKNRTAGHVDNTGYVRIGYKKRHYQSHTLAWLLFYGSLPSGVIDHINGVKHDNRIVNLRDVSRKENLANNPNTRERGGSVGVVKFRKRWRAEIWENGKNKHLGVYDTKEDAIQARDRYITEKGDS